ncbi:hypothetical protein [Winogradskyella sp. 3972H.M.0a.05]|uniref:hypothetical protein n=1 Tax=Winogradskyella sp. 3972H.M.0a.05 TaxID=2950277 RepID=UPI003394422E
MKIGSIKIIAFILIGAVFIVGCTTVTEDDLIEPVQQTVVITYDNTVKSIIDNNCIVCHTEPPENGAPMPLLTFEQVREAIENRGLIDRISSTDPGFLMPFGGSRLPQPLIDQVVQWQEDGLLEE